MERRASAIFQEHNLNGCLIRLSLKSFVEDGTMLDDGTGPAEQMDGSVSVQQEIGLFMA